jgi:predicted nucleic acid-binding protein
LALYFFDSSALVKRYANETGTVWVLSLLHPAAGHRLYIARIAGVEVVSSITRRERAGSLSKQDASIALTHFRRAFIHSYNLVEISELLVSRAMSLAQTHALRGYDAVQLAAALELYQQRLSEGLPAPTLISADAALNTAAMAEGLAVDDPNAH